MRHLCSFVVLLLSFDSFAADFKVFREGDKSRASISSEKVSEFYYEKPSWNLKITQIDEGSLFLKDRVEGHVYELIFTETEPNSSIFSLKMSPGSLKSKSIEVEIYSVPESLIKTEDRIAVVKNLIKNRSIARKPFLLRVFKKRGQIIDVFDEKETALASYERYKKRLGLDPSEDLKASNSIIEVSQTQQPEAKKVIDTSTLQSLFLANEAGSRSQGLKNAELRNVLTSIEKKRRLRVVKTASKWSSADKEAKNKLGQNLLKTALRATKNQDFVAAQTKFYQASNIVPDSENLYLQYGISLLRNGKYNQSIVVIQIAKPPENKITSKNFFLGMNFFKLEDWENAEVYFTKVMNSKDQELAPAAAFYLGNAQLKMSKFDASRVSFQYVLDNSKDPKMDRRAEQYIDFGIKQKAIAAKRSHRWFFDGVFGLFYDSNVILALDSQLDQPNVNLDTEGLRFLASNKVKYRPYYTEKNELAIESDITLIQTRDMDLGSNPELEKADPLVFSVGVPWTHRGVLWSRGYAFDLKPAYETIFMDLDGEGKKNIINSLVLNFDNTLVISPTFVAKANYQIRKDTADIGGSDDASATKFVADFSSIIVLNKDSERYLIPNLGWSLNEANSSTFSFTRIDAGITLTNSIFEKFIWTNKLGFYLANYQGPSGSPRTDKNYALTSGLGYVVNAHWNAGLNFNYQVNDSNTNAFKKFQGMLTMSYSY